jgi:hypothetical protein
LNNRALSEEINQMVRVEENHWNEFYKTKQKVKRELDAREQK